ncbi:MAG: large-conductance mechanosensitive channel protein MscL [Phycisphaerales bacterium]
MGFISEFRDFALKGNVVDMAVGIVIGAAFGTIVKSLVDDIIMPVVGMVTGGVDFSDMKYKIKDAVVASDGVEAAEAVFINYGLFINSMITFVIVAFALFIVIKSMNKAKARFEKEVEEAPKEDPADIKLLGEIRDLLKK